jgi:O-antigen/teichoic acid export membrane protein
MIMLVIIGSVGTSWGAHYLKIAENDALAPLTLGVLASKIWYFYCLAGSIYIIWVKDLILLATPPTYIASVPIAKWIIFSYLVYGSYLLFMNGLFAAKKTRFVPIASVSAAILNILLNLILIPIYGMIGAVIATLASFSLMALIVSFLSNKIYPINITIYNFIKPFFLFVFMFYFSFYADHNLQPIFAIVLKFVLTTIFTLILFYRVKTDGFKKH